MAMYQAEPKTSNMPRRSSTGARAGWSLKYWSTRWGLRPSWGNRLPRIEAAASTTSRTRAVRMERYSRQGWRRVSPSPGRGGVCPEGAAGGRTSTAKDGSSLQGQSDRPGPDLELGQQGVPEAGEQQQADHHQHPAPGQLEQPEPGPQGREPAKGPPEAEGGDQERHAKPDRVGEQQQRPPAGPAPADGGQPEHGPEGRADAGRPAEPEHHPKRQGPGEPAGDLVGPQAPLPVQEAGLDHPGQEQAHDDHQHPGDPGDQVPVQDQPGGDGAQGRPQ